MGTRRRPATPPAPDPAIEALDAFALRLGDTVRFQRTDGGTWTTMTVIGIGADRSITMRDDRGATRSIVAERLEVLGRSRRGAKIWEPVVERASRPEQRALF